MNVEIGTEAALFPEKEYINGNFRCSVAGVKGGHPLATRYHETS
jgi:hypothetical protein